MDITVDVYNFIYKNEMLDDDDEIINNVKAGAGGVIEGNAAESKTYVDNSTQVNIGDGTAFTVLEDAYGNAGTILLATTNYLYLFDRVKLDTGGVITGVGVTSYLINDTNESIVNVGDVDFTSAGDITLATVSFAFFDGEAYARTYGVAGVAIGDAIARTHADELVTVGSGATFFAEGDINLLAGQDATGAYYDFQISTSTDIWNGTAVCVTNADAKAEIILYNTITVESGVLMESVRDINVIAQRYGKSIPYGFASGKDWVHELGSALADGIDSLFGSDGISADMKNQDTTVEVYAGVEINGTLRVSIRNKTIRDHLCRREWRCGPHRSFRRYYLHPQDRIFARQPDRGIEQTEGPAGHIQR